MTRKDKEKDKGVYVSVCVTPFCPSDTHIQTCPLKPTNDPSFWMGLHSTEVQATMAWSRLG